MTAVRKKLIRRTKELVIKPEEDLSKYTLPSPVEETAPEVENPITKPSDEESFGQSKTGKIWITVFGILILIALAGGFLIYRNDAMKSTTLPTPAEKPQITLIPTTLPTSEPLVLSKYKIKILNGSGIAGEAARIKALLEEEKFVVLEVGNADKSDYQKVVIQVKKSVPAEFIDKLKIFLEKSYNLEAVAELSDADRSDVIIILSKEKTTTSQ